MSKVILEFDSYEDRAELRHAMKGGGYYCALWDISEEILRKACRYGHIEQTALSAEEVVLMERVRSQFQEILDKYGISLSEVE